MEKIVSNEAAEVPAQAGSGSVQIVELDETRGDAVALLFARAFQDDPILVHACPNAEERARWLPWLEHMAGVEVREVARHGW